MQSVIHQLTNSTNFRISERYVVVGDRLGRGFGGHPCTHVVAAAARGAGAPAASAAQQHYAIAPHPGAFPLVAVLVGVFVGLKPAFDVYLLALHEVLGERLGLLPPQIDVVPLRALLTLAALVVPDLGGRKAEFGDGSTARRIAQLGIATEVSDENDFINRSHRRTILLQPS